MLSSVNSPYWLVSLQLPSILLHVSRLAPGDVSSGSRFRVVIVGERRQRDPRKPPSWCAAAHLSGLDGALSQGSTASGALSGRSITDGQCDAAGDRRTRDASRSPSHLNVRRSELAAAPSTPSIEAPLDEHVDVFTLSHWCRAGMPRRMVDQVGLIVGRTNDPKPTHGAVVWPRPARTQSTLLPSPR